MKQPLTPRQQDVYDALVVFHNKEGYMPNNFELAGILGLKSHTSIWYHVESLIEKGWLKRTKWKIRGIRFT